jgi:hypothetical protein
MVMRANAGEGLACRAHEHDFDQGGKMVRRGVVSYYAAATMTRATTLRSWLHLVDEMSQKDLDSGRLTPFYQPILQIGGDGDLPLIGKPAGNAPREGTG